MLRLIVVAAASIGLILLVAFIAARVVQSRRRGLSIRMQVFIALGTIIFAFALGLGLMVIDRIQARATRFAVAATQEKAQVVAKLLGGEIERHGVSLVSVSRALPKRAAEDELVGVELFGPGQELLFASPNTTPRKPGDGWVTAEAAIFAHERLQGRVRVGKATIAMEQLLADFAPTVLVISLVLGAAAALAAAWIGRTIAGPIEALSAFAQNVSSGDERRVLPPVPWGREVTRLTEAIDSMRRQLEGRPFVETFAADLSHELKNPVAAIRASSEILAEGALDEPAEARRFVARIRESTERIERLLAELLGLARIETHGLAATERIAMAPLLQRVAEQSTTPTRVGVHITHEASVRGDPLWITRAIANLLDNALLHSPATSQVRISMRTDGPLVKIAVANAGRVPSHARAQLFRRFFTTRADKGGTGLGLPIVRAIAEAHRGRIELAKAGPPEVLFELTLPRY